jgi:predicted Rossmann fold flavoprotein
MDCDVAVIGAGAAGILAATRAAERGRRVLLLEKNRRAGVKILMSGGTRCNVTHDTDVRGIVAAYGSPGKFLHSALAALGPRELRALVEAEGCALKVEPGGKVFPVSDRATDVLAALKARFDRSGATLLLEHPVTALTRTESGFRLETPARVIEAPTVIVTTGGKSYPGSGTTGDGYPWLAALGHHIIPPRPSLTPILVDAPWAKELSGVTIPDVALKVIAPPRGEKPKPVILAERRGSLLFTHFGLSGPVALDVSRAVSGAANPRELTLECDFLPGVKESALAELAETELRASGKRQLASIVLGELPRRLTEQFLVLAAIDPSTRAAELPKAQRQTWIALHKHCRIGVTGTRGFEKAEVTAGGVDLREVDSSTMQSKLIPGLYLAGEILDLDGPIGGFNFQAAFSTAWLAAESV